MRKWLIRIRNELNLSTYAIAKISGISQSYYSQIETGKRNVPVHTAKKIAAAMNFDWQRFFD